LFVDLDNEIDGPPATTTSADQRHVTEPAMAARILEMEQAYERVAPPTPSRMPTILAALLGVAGFAAAAVSLGSSVQLAASMREMQELGSQGR